MKKVFKKIFHAFVVNIATNNYKLSLGVHLKKNGIELSRSLPIMIHREKITQKKPKVSDFLG